MIFEGKENQSLTQKIPFCFYFFVSWPAIIIMIEYHYLNNLPTKCNVDPIGPVYRHMRASSLALSSSFHYTAHFIEEEEEEEEEEEPEEKKESLHCN